MPAAYNNRGLAKFNLKDYSGAIADCTKAITLNPQFTEAYINRANNEITLNDYFTAVSDYSKAIAINPQRRGRL